MAVTFADTSPVSDNVAGRLRFKTVTLTFDSSYPTNGETFLASQIGFTSIVNVLIAQPPSGHVVDYDFTNSKLKVYWSGTASAVLNEVTNATNLSTLVVRATFIGY